MSNFDLTRLVVAIICAIGIFVFALYKFIGKNKVFSTRFISSTAIFAAISTLLYVVPYFKFNLPFFPAFLEMHFEEVPAFIAAFAYGPLSGFFVLLIKTIIKLPFTSSLGVGELADLIYGCALILPGAFIYRKFHNFNGTILGLSVGFFVQLIVSSFFTTFVILDFYMFVMGFSYEMLIGMCQAVNPNITSLTWPFFIYVAVPFNAFKNIIIVLLTLILYKKIHQLVDRLSQRKQA